VRRRSQNAEDTVYNLCHDPTSVFSLTSASTTLSTSLLQCPSGLMVSFAWFRPPALFALLFTPTTSATSTSKHATHRTHYIGASRSLKLEAFHPQSIFEANFCLFVP
jgi:hypothetical protein